MAQPQPDAVALQKLCLHAHSFTSFVSIEPPNALLLEIKGSVKLFGSLQRLHEGLDARWRRLALPARSAIAPSTLAALWLARAGAPSQIENVELLRESLAKVPIACTAWDAERLQTLRAMGVTHLGELMRLPRAGLARRLTPALVRDLDIALARQMAPRRAFVRRERFRERCDFETEIEQTAYLEKALEPLIEHCAQFLRRRQAGIQALRLKLRHREGPATCVQSGLASITSERRRLSDVLCQKLAQLDLHAPVRGMELISGSLRGFSASSLDVFAGFTGAGQPRQRAAIGGAFARTAGRGGGVWRLLIPEHRPEAAWRRVHELRLSAAAGIERGSHRSEAAASGVVIERTAAACRAGNTAGSGTHRERLVGWQRRSTRLLRRPSVPMARRLWVFQERQSKRWYLHGIFA